MRMSPLPAQNGNETYRAEPCQREGVLHRASAWLLLRTAAPLR